MEAALGIEHLGFFVLSGWLLNLTPGPDVLYIVSQALRNGVRAGMVAALGITAGCFVHIVAAGVGVSALLATSAMAFVVLKWVGAAYLVGMGIRMLISKSRPTICMEAGPHDVVADGCLNAIFFRGLLTNVLNPKVALFFLAFLPQFIVPGSPHQTLAFVLLGVLFNLNAIPVNIGYALLAGWVAQRTTSVQKGLHGVNRLAGALFVGFGIKLALTAAPHA